jgi:tetratricopeptide (TPR) repeat protein
MGATRYTCEMSIEDADWEKQLSDLWADLDMSEENDFIRRMEKLVAMLPPGSAIGLFELGGAYDSTGNPDKAVALYSAALETGLAGERRRRAVIQMSSSIRNLGKPQEAVDLLTAETVATSDELDGAVAATLALALVDVGREREAVSVALTALSKYLPRYNRSMANYAKDLLSP